MAGVLRLLSPVGVTGPAVRTAISRMVVQGWLEPATLPGGPGYRATEAAERRFADTSARIYATAPPPWDGTWHMVLGDPPSNRTRRERLRADLAFLGYAPIAAGAWISPYPRANLPEVLARAGLDAHSARVTELNPAPLSAWDLDRLASQYAAWPALSDRIVRQARHADGTDEAAFTARFHLVHEWRKFLFQDPGLPRELLPDDWPGTVAAQNFTEVAGSLKPAADRFLDSCLDAAATSPSAPG